MWQKSVNRICSLAITTCILLNYISVFYYYFNLPGRETAQNGHLHCLHFWHIFITGLQISCIIVMWVKYQNVPLLSLLNVLAYFWGFTKNTLFFLIVIVYIPKSHGVKSGDLTDPLNTIVPLLSIHWCEVNIKAIVWKRSKKNCVAAK